MSAAFVLAEERAAKAARDLTAPSMASPLRKAAEHRLPPGRTLSTFVSIRRRRGKGWRRIAAELRDETGLSISHVTLRRWFDPKPGRAA